MKEEYDGMLKMDGYDDCILGICERFGQERIIVYDKIKVLEKLSKDMSWDEAEEFFYYNQIGAWMGDLTPCFVTLDEDIIE